MKRKKIIVVGAGPKALALAAKNTALERIGIAVPEMLILEKNGIAAHWKGNSGYTNGRLTLGTSPEKDVGFPYQTSMFSHDVNESLNREMFRFSWTQHLISTNRYSDWVDRGRPAPTHKQWADYLCAVAQLFSPSVKIVRAEVTNFSLHDNHVEVKYLDCEKNSQSVIGDGLVLTGPGKQKLSFEVPQDPRVMTLENFWKNLGSFNDTNPIKIAVVGNGENAASMLLALLELGHPGMELDLISPVGMIYSRGESFFENRVYSNPDNANWKDLEQQHRKEFVRRTDLGVFSLAAVQKLN